MGRLRGLSLTKLVPAWDTQTVLPHGFAYIGFFSIWHLIIFLGAPVSAVSSIWRAAGRGGDGWPVEDSSWTHLMIGWTLPRH